MKGMNISFCFNLICYNYDYIQAINLTHLEIAQQSVERIFSE